MSTQSKVRSVVLVVLIALLITVIIQNTETATLKLFFWEIEASRIFVFAGIAVAGFFAGGLTVWLLQRRRRTGKG